MRNKKLVPEDPHAKLKLFMGAMALMDIEVSEPFSKLMYDVIDRINKKGGQFDLKDAAELKIKAKETFHNLAINYPSVKYIQSLENREDSRQEQLTDINQWARLLVNNINLRPRVWRGIAVDILNRTTD